MLFTSIVLTKRLHYLWVFENYELTILKKYFIVTISLICKLYANTENALNIKYYFSNFDLFTTIIEVK